jgi:hypothetical protein
VRVFALPGIVMIVWPPALSLGRGGGEASPLRPLFKYQPSASRKVPVSPAI